MLWLVQCLLRPLEHLLIQRPLLQGNDAFTPQRRGCSLSRAGEAPMRSGEGGRAFPRHAGVLPSMATQQGLHWADVQRP